MINWLKDCPTSHPRWGEESKSRDVGPWIRPLKSQNPKSWNLCETAQAMVMTATTMTNDFCQFLDLGIFYLVLQHKPTTIHALTQKMSLQSHFGGIWTTSGKKGQLIFFLHFNVRFLLSGRSWRRWWSSILLKLKSADSVASNTCSCTGDWVTCFDLNCLMPATICRFTLDPMRNFCKNAILEIDPWSGPSGCCAIRQSESATRPYR